MAAKNVPEAQNPLILRCNRLIEAFAKSDDERDFYVDRREGFIIYVELDKSDDELAVLEKELNNNIDRYCMVPKLTFYETKKIMEGFINEKVYDIDTKEKLLDIIQSKEARENFLEFIYDHHSELEKWLTYYQERSRIRIIEWLRSNQFHFVFEEDLELPPGVMEKLKKELFQTKVGKDVLNARKTLASKAKTYYSNEALNPRPKRGRPPKQIQKAEVEPQVTIDIYTTVPNGLRSFLFSPDLHGGSSGSFSSKFGYEEDLFSGRRLGTTTDPDISAESLTQKLAAIRSLSSKWAETEIDGKKGGKGCKVEDDFDDDDEDEDEDFEEEIIYSAKKSSGKGQSAKAAKKALPAKSSAKAPVKKAGSSAAKGSSKNGAVLNKKVTKPTVTKPAIKSSKPTSKKAIHLRPITKKAPAKPPALPKKKAVPPQKKAVKAPQKPPAKKVVKPPVKAAPSKKPPLRPIKKLKKR